jgi:hypothetical protein
MLFDEIFIFKSHECAKSFLSVLKEGGVKTRINETMSNLPRDYVTGKMEDINSWLLALSEEREDLKDAINLMHKKNLELKDRIDNYLKDKSKGDFLYTHDELKRDTVRAYTRLQEEIKNSDPNDFKSANGLLPELLDTSSLSIIHRLLKEQGILEECEEGYILKDDITGADIIYKAPAMDLRFCEGPAFSGLKLLTIFEPTIRYEVTVSIIDIIDIDLEELKLIMLACDMKSDDAVNMATDHLFKKSIIGLILKGVDENNGISAEELSLYIMDKWNSLKPFDNRKTELKLREEIVTAFISELKKAGIIAGNVNSLRIAPVKSRKKKR